MHHQDVAGTGLPVTVVVARRPAPGRTDELVAWAGGIVAAAEEFPGHLGAEVYPPSLPDRDELVLAFSFASADALKAWEDSPVRQDWIARSQPLVAGPPTTHAVSGFEAIFAHRPGTPVVPPARWKTAVVIALALYPMSVLLGWLVAPHTAGWNLLLRVLLTTAVVVPYMAWVGVPAVSRWLHSWLHSDG